jgi:Outer membrane lipoprotein-sorting protein
MKRVFLLLTFTAIFVLSGFYNSIADEMSPKQILDKTLDRNYDDLVLDVDLIKINKSGRERPMSLIVKIKNEQGLKKTIAEFTGPPEVKGMKSLSWDYEDETKEDGRWFKLVGLDFIKCKGKACQNMEDRFGFSMNIFSVDVDEASHELSGEEEIGGAVCYKIKSQSKDPDNPDGANITVWIDKEKFAARKIETYDKDGNILTTSEFTGFMEVGDHWWETKGQLDKVKSKKKIRFEINEAKVNEGIDDSVFARPDKKSKQKPGPD